MAKTKYLTLSAKLYWAKVFPENMDDNMDYHQKTNGQYNVQIGLDEENLEKLLTAGFATKRMGSDMIRKYDYAGDLSVVKLKRPNVHPTVPDFGGAPTVYDWREGKSTEPWSFENQGIIGNGSDAEVILSLYGEGSTQVVRLEKIAVTRLEVFNPTDEDDIGW